MYITSVFTNSAFCHDLGHQKNLSFAQLFNYRKRVNCAILGLFGSRWVCMGQ